MSERKLKSQAELIKRMLKHIPEKDRKFAAKAMIAIAATNTTSTNKDRNDG